MELTGASFYSTITHHILHIHSWTVLIWTLLSLFSLALIFTTTPSVERSQNSLNHIILHCTKLRDGVRPILLSMVTVNNVVNSLFVLFSPFQDRGLCRCKPSP